MRGILPWWLTRIRSAGAFGASRPWNRRGGVTGGQPAGGQVTGVVGISIGTKEASVLVVLAKSKTPIKGALDITQKMFEGSNMAITVAGRELRQFRDGKGDIRPGSDCCMVKATNGLAIRESRTCRDVLSSGRYETGLMVKRGQNRCAALHPKTIKNFLEISLLRQVNSALRSVAMYLDAEILLRIGVPLHIREGRQSSASLRDESRAVGENESVLYVEVQMNKVITHPFGV